MTCAHCIMLYEEQSNNKYRTWDCFLFGILFTRCLGDLFLVFSSSLGLLLIILITFYLFLQIYVYISFSLSLCHSSLGLLLTYSYHSIIFLLFTFFLLLNWSFLSFTNYTCILASSNISSSFFPICTSLVITLYYYLPFFITFFFGIIFNIIVIFFFANFVIFCLGALVTIVNSNSIWFYQYIYSFPILTFCSSYFFFIMSFRTWCSHGGLIIHGHIVPHICIVWISHIMDIVLDVFCLNSHCLLIPVSLVDIFYLNSLILFLTIFLYYGLIIFFYIFTSSSFSSIYGNFFITSYNHVLLDHLKTYYYYKAITTHCPKLRFYIILIVRLLFIQHNTVSEEKMEIID